MLPKQGLVGLDSAPLIYLIERHPLYRGSLTTLWEGAKQGELTLVLSEFALSEALVMPLREGNAKLIRAYDAITEGRGFRTEPVSWRTLRRAAELRASKPSLRTPDAIHIASAELVGCDAFVTNDKSLREANLPNVIILDDVIREGL